MDKAIDKRGMLEDDVFTYRISKDKKVFISWYGKQVTALNGSKAESFISDIEEAQGKEAQLIMAKVTSNFKCGNDRQAKRTV